MSQEIKAIGELINADKFEHCTRDPIFMVQQKIREYGMDTDYCGDDIAWLDEEGHPVDSLKAKRLEALYDDLRFEATKKFTRTGYQDRWEHVTSCFTKQGAEDFIRIQQHNLRETRIYADSLFRNHEMIAVREHLKSLATPKVAKRTNRKGE